MGLIIFKVLIRTEERSGDSTGFRCRRKGNKARIQAGQVMIYSLVPMIALA